MLDSVPLAVDLDMARAFLATLDPFAIEFTFQTIDDNRDRERIRAETAKSGGKKTGSPFAAVMHGSLDQLARRLTTLNANGAGVFVAVQSMDGGGRKLENLRRFRAIFAEDDGEFRNSECPLQPHLVTSTREGHYHRWYLTEELTHLEYAKLMSAMVALGSDPDAKDPCRVLRLPGFRYRKIDSAKGLNGAGQIVRVVEEHDIARYTPEALFAALGRWVTYQTPQAAASEPERPPGAPNLRRSDVNVAELDDALSAIDPESRDTWLRMGMALHHAGFPGAREMWDRWSRRSGKYDPEDQQRTWESYRADERVSPIGLGSLYAAAKSAGWQKKDWSAGLLRNKDGEIRDIPANVALILDAHPDWRGSVRLNLVTGEIEAAHCPIAATVWSDTHDVETMVWLRQHMRMAVRHAGTVRAAVDLVASQHAYDPILDYLNALPPWDGVPRLEHFFVDCCEADDTAYTRWCGTMFFCGAVARALDPGCQHRYCLILQGPQDIGKSKLVHAIGGQWYGEIDVNAENKDIYLLINRLWIAEFPEMETFGRTSVKRMKSFISQISDDYRAPYGHRVMRHRRRCVFVATTNEDFPLMDETGNTRYFPLSVERADYERARDNRDQLMAEALVRVRDGFLWWQQPNEVRDQAHDHQEEATVQDPWFSMIVAYLEKTALLEISIEEIAMDCLKLDPGNIEKKVAMRIGHVMAQLKKQGGVVTNNEAGTWTRKQKRTQSSEKSRTWIYRRD